MCGKVRTITKFKTNFFKTKQQNGMLLLTNVYYWTAPQPKHHTLRRTKQYILCVNITVPSKYFLSSSIFFYLFLFMENNYLSAVTIGRAYKFFQKHFVFIYKERTHTYTHIYVYQLL